MEPEVHVRCRKSDYPIVEKIIAQATEEYKTLMKAEVKSLKNKDFPLTLILDSKKFLPEFKEASQNPADSCMGGIMMHARLGRIVCTNTLDERLQLVYQEAIPQIREHLFPCLVKAPKPEKKEEVSGHHKH